MFHNAFKEKYILKSRMRIGHPVYCIKNAILKCSFDRKLI